MNANWYSNLRVQIVFLMTLALLPLGAVAIYQTNLVASQAQRNADLALLALTERAAKAEELIIERALGAAEFFAAVAPDFIANPERCRSGLAQFVADDDDYSFIGILPLSGVMTCTSSGRIYDFSGYPDFEEIMAAQMRTISVNTEAPLSGTSVFVVSEPFQLDGEFAGFISVSIPHNQLPGASDEFARLGLEELVIFNSDGDVLTARSDIQTALAELPADRDLAALWVTGSDAFKGRNAAGEVRRYTVVPIEGSPAAVMGVWRADQGLGSTIAAFVKPALFPVLMWLASMSVALLSIYSLVLRHIGRLRKNMDEFAKTRSTEAIDQTTPMPSELQALNDNFARMTDDLLRDEARSENALREKNVLIKEVHHRVKNNLQMISSIMNMQIRTARHQETKSVLARLQDRVLSLATIHRDLYQSQHGGMVDVGTLVSEVVQNSLEIAISNERAVDVDKDIDAVLLFPDQAVPLSLMIAEAMTNAMKYLGAPDGARPWVRVSLKQEGADCTLTLANSIGASKDVESTGLGTQLIQAFSVQLGGTIETDESADAYTIIVRFQAEDFVPESRDF